MCNFLYRLYLLKYMQHQSGCNILYKRLLLIKIKKFFKLFRNTINDTIKMKFCGNVLKKNRKQKIDY